MAEAIYVIDDDVSVDKATPLLASQQRRYFKEQVWEEIFQEKCAITVQQNDILYVQESVECFVSEVIQRVLESDTYGTFISAVDKKDLIQFNQHFSVNNLLHVGSFYEGTKNSYPNEFDFIFVLAEYSAKDYRLLQKLTSDLSDLFHEELKNVISEPSVEIGESFEQCSFSGLHGPASKIKVVFNEAAALRERVVDLDISAASRLRFETCLPKEIEVCYNEWIEMILETGSVLAVKVYKADHPIRKTEVKITITETEQYFVRNVMTENHRKVYRLLKYVFNGNDANETLKRLVRSPYYKQTTFSRRLLGRSAEPRTVYDLSSYTIKTLMFHHVHRCRNTEEGIAECLTEVLRSLLAEFDRFIDSNSDFSHYPELLGLDGVSVKTMIRQPLQITDYYPSTVITGKKLAILAKTAENIEQTRETMRADLDEQIPFTEQHIDMAQHVLEYRGKYFQVVEPVYTVCFVIAFILLLLLCPSLVAKTIQERACDTSSNNSSSRSIDVQYCCIGTKGISERWRNVTCSKSNIFSRHSDNISESISNGLKNAFACMALTAAKNIDVGKGDVYYAWNDVALCSGNVSKITEEVEMCLYCNVSLEDPRDYEVFLPTPNQDSLCSGISPCRLDELGKQVNSFLKIKAEMFNDVQMHEFSNCDTENIFPAANCTSNPLQTCTENMTHDGRTEICCSTSDSGLNRSTGPTDKCLYYTNIRDIVRLLVTILAPLLVCTLIVVVFILIGKQRKKAKQVIVRKLRQHMTNETGTSIQQIN